MHTLPKLCFLFLPLLSFISSVTAISSAREKFNEMAKKAPNGIIQLNNELFDEITSKDRDWMAIVQITAMGKDIKCTSCHSWDPKYTSVAKSWTTVPADKRDGFYFATLDFANGRETFMKLGISSAPFVFVYPAVKGSLRPANGQVEMWMYNFNDEGIDSESFAKSMSRYSPVPVPYREPPNYSLLITIGISAFIVTLVCTFLWPYVSAFVTSRWIWGMVCIYAILTYTGGYMFVKIRKMPMTVEGRNGPAYIAAGFQTQYGMETQIVSVLYGTLALAHLALIFLVPRIPGAARQRAGVYLWSGISVLLFSVLLGFFRLKNNSYPFRLFF
jgi:oligosaccharyltransferase complex subunit gamma